MEDIAQKPTCLFCSASIKKYDQFAVCSVCHVTVHTDCAAELDYKCPALGCNGKLVVNPGQVHITVSGSKANEVEFVARSLLKQTQDIHHISHQERFRMIKILILAANPKDTPNLRLDEEVREIDAALRRTDNRDMFDVRQHWAIRVSDIQEILLRYKPDIVHFSGHGSSAGEIVLEDNSGYSKTVSPAAISKLFSVLKDNIRCVILNACYSEIQADAISDCIDCVIGMSKEIGDDASIRFSVGFYQALGYGRDVKTAFDLGCLQIQLDNLQEEKTPKLLSKKINPSRVVFIDHIGNLIPQHAQIGEYERSEDDNVANVLGKKRETIQVDIVITTTGERYTINLGLDVLVKHAIPKLVELLKLPTKFENNWPVNYFLYNKTQGKELDNDLTFRQNDIQYNNTLAFYVGLTAG